jgi:hypothetical protein
MPGTTASVGRRWLLIQLHRAQIGRILRSRSAGTTEEIAARMNAIALLCDCGRTEVGQLLAMTLARDGRLDPQSIGLPAAELSEPS